MPGMKKRKKGKGKQRKGRAAAAAPGARARIIGARPGRQKMRAICKAGVFIVQYLTEGE